MFSPTKLRHVIAVDRAGSITKAANLLNITQSSVTKSVAEIEREIGYDLFDRKSRGVVTTDDGREFLDRASRIVADLDLLSADAKAGNQSREAVFRIGVCPTSIEGLINRTLKDFIIKNPGICVHLQSSSVERGIKNLRRGDIDILFGPVDPIGPVVAVNQSRG
jgi:DNA-binding transcriptional LysR family regulator